MAAKQGLSAQISQASEDAKRAVLQRTSLTNSLWFSNLNTTCTIKSAPPRTPDVLGLLANKSGWLFKRNEQHVWQARYCCVVPHTFLYYFDAHPTNPCLTPQLTARQQETLNNAVRQGYGKRGQSQPRSSLYHVLGAGGGAGGGGSGTAHIPLPPDETENVVMNPTTTTTTTTTTSNTILQPVGIIDLECYTTIHRNSQNELLMELAGDEMVNPDLRSFYFCANSDHEGEEWTQALLGERHSSLVDEREAYKQVCDGFAQQLQILHTELDDCRQQADTQQEELYRVRSQMEDTRRSCLRLVDDVMLERDRDGTISAKRAYKTDLETIRAQDLGILPAVQVLCDYTRVLEETCNDSGEQINKLEEELKSKQHVDTSKFKEMEIELERLKEESIHQQRSYQSQMETLTQKYVESQKECQDVQKDLASQRLEMTMYQSSTRTKMGELQSHKKILKKEVIELRKKLEEANSELDLYRHRATSVKMEAEQERQKSHLLERYVEKIESQVKVQQNMMEMMSQAGSVYGGGGGSVYGGSQFGTPPPPTGVEFVRTTDAGSVAGGRKSNIPRPPSSNYGDNNNNSINVIVNPPSSVRHGIVHDDEDDDDDNDDEDDDDDEEDEEEEEVRRSGGRRCHGIPRSKRKLRRRRNVDDVDNKSHMSELTEDRTQKQFDAALFVYSTNPQLRAALNGSPRGIPPLAGPPTIIGVAEEGSATKSGGGGGVGNHTNNKGSSSGQRLDTIMSTTTTTNRTPVRVSSLPPDNRLAYPSPGGSDTSPTLRSGGGDRSVDRILLETSSVGTNHSKLSVAQRARLEADRQTTPIKVRLNQTPLRGNNSGGKDNSSRSSLLSQGGGNEGSSNSQSGGSFLAALGRRIEDVIDSSILGVDDNSDTDGSGYATTDVQTDVQTDVGDDDRYRDEKKTGDAVSEASTTAGLSLAQRQALQRAQQLKFLKEQGLIHDEKDVKGGAGSDSKSVGSRMSLNRGSARIESV